MSMSDKLRDMLGARTTQQQQASEAFLTENATREGVTVLPSGLQYEVLHSGDGGAQPGPTSMVTVHYEGRLADGSVFDSSYKRGQPATFGVHQVISGWTEAMQLMHAGDKWRLYIPSELGYGARGAGGSIPPHAALVFDVELISVR
ncbi:MAG: FKBP-type peptidyl-prolyl cis-trans isomerase [Sphingobacteriales bacterium]|nr:MAG: FKBP-type peptidyl-prolyl cis-trans isomerase [Sphingobacteriales bacterium]